VTSVRPARYSAAPDRRRRPARRPNHSNHSNPPAARVDSSAVRQLEDALAAAQHRPDPPAKPFAEYGLPTQIVDVLARSGIKQPTAIQARTLADALAGRDVLGRAQTGSGKTLGFGLPMLTRLHAASGSRQSIAPRGLVLVPTRELSAQVAAALTPAAGALGLHVATVVGGLPINKQMAELRRGVDVLVATPGRLMDLMDRRAVRLDSVQIAVLDEADHMADLGFLPAVTTILDATPETRQCMLFSATLDRGVGRLVTRYLTDPAIHAVGTVGTPVDAMDHRVFVLEHEDKVPVAAEIGARPGRTLFFVRTKHGADRLAKQLSRLGVDSAAIHGNLNQNQRGRALAAFSSGRSRVLVATDVAARGLHVDDLDLVVHYDPPADHKDYLHRSGRTARAGATGTVVSFVEPAQAREVARMHAAASVSPQATRVRPGHGAVREIADSGEVIDVAPEPWRTPPSKPYAQRSSRHTGARRGAGHPSGRRHAS
jgi:superfamily II DNA/RNA helicase